jgi:hypothetical protein
MKTTVRRQLTNMSASRRDGDAKSDSAGHAQGGDSGLIDLDGLLAEMTDAAIVAPRGAPKAEAAAKIPAEIPAKIPHAPAIAPPAPILPPLRRWRVLAGALAGSTALVLGAALLASGAQHGRQATFATSIATAATAVATATATVRATTAARAPAADGPSPPPALTPESLHEAAVAGAQPAPLAPAPLARPIHTGPPGADPEQPASISLVDVPSSPDDPADLSVAMRKATGGAGDATAAPSSIGAQPGKPTLRPPTGALNAAIATAVREARACIATGDPTVHASISFDADGIATASVPSVASSLPGAQACVTKALSRARIAPFVEAPIAVPVTVRPAT